MGKTTIVYIGGFELPDKNAAAQRVLANGKILRSLGYKVYFYGMSKDHLNNDNAYLDDNFVFAQSAYPQNFKEWYHHLTSYSKIIDFIEENIGENPDIIIAYNYPSVALNRLRIYCKFNKIKLVADITEWYNPHGNLLLYIMRFCDINFRMRYVHYKLDGIIVISSYLYKFYQKTVKSVLLLPPLVDIEDKKWDITKVADFDPKLINLVFAGSAGPNKDRLDIIIESLAVINNRSLAKKFHLYVIGATKDDLIQRFKGSTIPENIDSFVSFKGQLSHTEALKYVVSADFTIFLRKNNIINKAGFPTKFVESLTAGVPVLTNNTSDIFNYLIDGANGFGFNSLKIDKIVEKLEVIVNLQNNQIQEMKVYCKSHPIFDYRQYCTIVNDFLRSL